MKIKKVLNNNVVTIVDEKSGLEKVVMGRGIAFKKRRGEDIDTSKVEKVFSLENKDKHLKFQKLINDIPIEYVKISERIIAYAKEKLIANFDEYIYIALTDHLAFAIKRGVEGIEIKNPLLWEIQRLHPKEYKIGLWAVRLIKDELKVNLAEDEAGFIAIHLVNGAMGKDMTVTMEMLKIVKEILNIIKYHFTIEFDDRDISYDRMVTHIRYFAQRVVLKKQFKDDDTSLLDVIKENYSRYYNCAVKIRDYVDKKYNFKVSDGEVVYLTLHIHRVVSRINRKEEDQNGL